MFSTAYAADFKWNDMHRKNPRFNKLFKAARAELDEKKRRKMYVEMQQPAVILQAAAFWGIYIS